MTRATGVTLVIAGRVARVMGATAGWLYVVLALYICFDVIARRLLGFSSQATVEVSGYLLATAICWGLGATLMERGHIRVDIVVSRLSVRPRAVMHTIAVCWLTLFALLLTWRAWDTVFESFALQARDLSALSIPLIVPQGLWALGISAFLIVAVAVAADALALLFAGRLALLESRSGVQRVQDEVAVIEDLVHREAAETPTQPS